MVPCPAIGELRSLPGENALCGLRGKTTVCGLAGAYLPQSCALLRDNNKTVLQGKTPSCPHWRGFGEERSEGIFRAAEMLTGQMEHGEEKQAEGKQLAWGDVPGTGALAEWSFGGQYLQELPLSQRDGDTLVRPSHFWQWP